ncbi:MAG: VOC family protein [Pseudomonadota bacterium]
MLAYTVIGTNKKEEALAFYDAILAEVGAQRAFANDRLQFYSNNSGAMLGIGSPWDQKDASCGNGVMPAIACPDKATVDRMHAKAIELGAPCEGEPGERVPGMFYGAYFRDPDGNKICAAHFIQS